MKIPTPTVECYEELIELTEGELDKAISCYDNAIGIGTRLIWKAKIEEKKTELTNILREFEASKNKRSCGQMMLFDLHNNNEVKNA